MLKQFSSASEYNLVKKTVFAANNYLDGSSSLTRPMFKSGDYLCCLKRISLQGNGLFLLEGIFDGGTIVKRVFIPNLNKDLAAISYPIDEYGIASRADDSIVEFYLDILETVKMSESNGITIDLNIGISDAMFIINHRKTHEHFILNEVYKTLTLKNGRVTVVPDVVMVVTKYSWCNHTGLPMVGGFLIEGALFKPSKIYLYQLGDKYE